MENYQAVVLDRYYYDPIISQHYSTLSSQLLREATEVICPFLKSKINTGKGQLQVIFTAFLKFENHIAWEDQL